MPAVQYSFTFGSKGLKMDYFATIDNVNRSLGMKTWKWNDDVAQYELYQRQDYSAFTMNADANLDDDIFEIPTDCVSDDSVVPPPDPRGYEVGRDVITSTLSQYTWGSEAPVVPEKQNLSLVLNDTATGRRLSERDRRELAAITKNWGPFTTSYDTNTMTYQISASGNFPGTPVSASGQASWSLAPSNFHGSGSIDLEVSCSSALGTFGLNFFPVNSLCPSGCFICGHLGAGLTYSGQSTCHFSGGNGQSYQSTKLAWADGSLSIHLGNSYAGASGSLFAKVRAVPQDQNWNDFRVGLRAGAHVEAHWPFNSWDKTFIWYPSNDQVSGNQCNNYFSTKTSSGASAETTKTVLTVSSGGGGGSGSDGGGTDLYPTCSCAPNLGSNTGPPHTSPQI